MYVITVDPDHKNDAESYIVKFEQHLPVKDLIDLLFTVVKVPHVEGDEDDEDDYEFEEDDDDEED